MSAGVTPHPNWKIIIAALLDFATMFAIGGIIVSKLSGQMTENAFSLSEVPALLFDGFVHRVFCCRQPLFSQHDVEAFFRDGEAQGLTEIGRLGADVRVADVSECDFPSSAFAKATA